MRLKQRSALIATLAVVAVGCGDKADNSKNAVANNTMANNMTANNNTTPNNVTPNNVTPNNATANNVSAVTVPCGFPLTIATPFAGVYVCDAASATACTVTNPDAAAAADVCDGNASFFFVVRDDTSVSAVNTNGWAVTGTSHGTQTANISVGGIPHDTDASVTLAGGGGDYELSFRVDGATKELTISAFDAL